MSSEGTRVRIIETQFVETDATHFKSIVQSLTGKDSTVGTKTSEGPSGSGHETGRAQEFIGGVAGGGRERGNDPAPATRVQEGHNIGAPTLDELRKLLGN